MTRQISCSAVLMLVMFQLVASPQQAAAVTTMIFCNGGMASAGNLSAAQINGYRTSGMNTMVIFNMGVAANGDFTYGGTICSNGVYVGPSNWGSLLSQCKAAPSSVTRIEMCIGGWTDPSFGNIRARIQADGTNTSTVLYRNLQALKTALQIDAIDFDTENTYDSVLDSQFGRMCVSTGFKVSLCPYTASSYWQALKNNIGTNCDQVYLQCYDGGVGNINTLTSWNTLFGGLKVVVGYWDWERDTTFLSKMQVGQAAGCSGGFLWPSCTGCNPPADGNEMAQYAAWILNTFNPVVTPVTAADVVGSQVTFAVSLSGNNSYQWQRIKSGVTNNIPGATNLTLTLANLQLTNTASYQLVVSNASGVLVSSPGSLTVSSAPVAVNNVITSYAAQTGLAYGFPLTPTWTIAPGSVISGQLPSTANGNFNLETFGGGRSVRALTVGDTLTMSQTGGVTGTNYVTCGNGSSAGSTLIYTLNNASGGGYDLTNITVYTGWINSDRDQQAYTISYSKMTDPSTFILLGSVNFNPVNAVTTVPSVARVMVTPASGSLATNVAAVKFDFTSPASENGYCGYAEIGLYGVASDNPGFGGTITYTDANGLNPVSSPPYTNGYVVYTFTASGTLTNPASANASVLVVGGGGGGGGPFGDGGGAGGLVYTNISLSSGTYGVTVGSGGAGTSANTSGTKGNNSVFSTLIALGGGGGGVGYPSAVAGQAGGSGGGGGGYTPVVSGGAATQPSSPSGGYGNAGFGGSTSSYGGGGGAGAAATSSAGGNGLPYAISGVTNYYAGGGGGCAYVGTGAGGQGGGGAGATTGNVGGNGAANTGGGGGGGWGNTGGSGGSGIIIVRYPYVPIQPWVATNPTNITYQVWANSLTLNWPSDHTGWRLQVQTNDLGAGLGTNWVDVVGSTTTNQLTIPVNGNNGSVFYRLTY